MKGAKTDEELSPDELKRINALRQAQAAIRQQAQDALNRARPEPVPSPQQAAQPEFPARPGALGGASVRDDGGVLDLVVTERPIGVDENPLGMSVTSLEAEESPAANMSRRVSDLVTRPTRGVGDQTARSSDGQRIAESAATPVNLSGIEEATRAQLEKLDRLDSTMTQMGKSFSQAAGRLASVAALAELRAAN